MENQTRESREMNPSMNPGSQKSQAASSKGAGAPLTRKLGDFDKNHEMESALTDVKGKGDKGLRNRGDEDSERNMTQMAKDWIAPITEQVGQFESRVEGFIKARPLTILAGVVVAGYLANRFLFSSSASAKDLGARK